jgi:hypothetical protein
MSFLSEMVKLCQKGLNREYCFDMDDIPMSDLCCSITAGYILRVMENVTEFPLDAATIKTSPAEFRARVLDLPSHPCDVAGTELAGHFRCGLNELKIDISHADYLLRYTEKDERFTKFRQDMELSVWPVYRHLGFLAKDLDLRDSDSEHDEDYIEMTGAGSGRLEPVEEYESDYFDDDTDEDEDDEDDDMEDAEEE